MSQFLTEALVLAFSGGVLGVLLAQWGVDMLLGIAPSNLPPAESISVNLPVLVFTSALTVGVAISLGFFAAWRAASADPGRELGDRGQSATVHTQQLGRVLVGGQLAITLTLLVGAGLLGRSLLHVLSVDPGFRTDHILTVDLALGEAEKDADRTHRLEFLNGLFGQLQALPGVQGVGGTGCLPLVPYLWNGTYVVINAGEKLPAGQALDRLFQDPSRTGEADYCVASGSYFRVLGIPLLRGRLFDDRDTMDAPHAALISESLAREKWPNQDPLGRTIEFGNMDGDMRLLTVVGVVGDVRLDGLESRPPDIIYVNYGQRPKSTWRFTMVIRTGRPPAALIPAARRIVRDLAPNVPPSFSTFTKVFSDSLKERRFHLLLVGIFAGTALTLAIAGIYGVTAYWVAQRRSEFGLRMALGAEVSDVLRLVLRYSLETAALGVAAGVVGSFVLTRTIALLLFGVSATDPLTFAGVATLLVLVTVAASFLPARRATKVDPVVALRHE